MQNREVDAAGELLYQKQCSTAVDGGREWTRRKAVWVVSGGSWGKSVW